MTMKATQKTLYPFAARAVMCVKSVNPWRLANPTDLDGAKWARQLVLNVAEAIEYANPKGPEDIDRLADERAVEMANEAVPIYTIDLFRLVLSLRAWDEPIDELGTPCDLLDAAQWAVYMIADRIIHALLNNAKHAASK